MNIFSETSKASSTQVELGKIRHAYQWADYDSLRIYLQPYQTWPAQISPSEKSALGQYQALLFFLAGDSNLASSHISRALLQDTTRYLDLPYISTEAKLFFDSLYIALLPQKHQASTPTPLHTNISSAKLGDTTLLTDTSISTSTTNTVIPPNSDLPKAHKKNTLAKTSGWVATTLFACSFLTSYSLYRYHLSEQTLAGDRGDTDLYNDNKDAALLYQNISFFSLAGLVLGGGYLVWQYAWETKTP